MAIILGMMTTVDIGGGSDGFQSISWNIQAQNNKLWSVGSTSPYATTVTVTESVNVSTYAGVINPITLAASTGCTDSAATLVVNVTPVACAGGITGIAGTFFVNSYSYSKSDYNGFGTESWSLQRWVDGSNLTAGTPGTVGYIKGLPGPTYTLQGISEGTYSNDAGIDPGVTGGTLGAQGSQGSVSAGFPGQGNVTDVETITQPTAVGDGSLAEPGTGNSSISIPHIPLYV